MASFVLVFLVCGILAQNQREPNKRYTIGWVKAENYKKMTEAAREIYIAGWLDSRLNAGFLSWGPVSKKLIQLQRDCVEGKSISQITAIVDRHIQGHPEYWDQPAALQADAALQALCAPLRACVEATDADCPVKLL